jgi:glycosyltransferase involved in cell wall biosynthesis
MNGMLSGMRAIVATSPSYAQTSPVLTDAAHRDRVRVIPLGIDEGFYLQRGDDAVLKRLELNEGEPFFLFIGVLRYYKGLHTLVQAAAKVSARVVIAGTAPGHSLLQAQVCQLGLQNIVFAGQISDAEKVTLLEGCTALVLPSHLRSEAFGMVLVEASMFGKPMVTCEIGTGTSFVNLHGETGFVVAPESPEALAHAMNTLLSDSSLAEKFGRAARCRYKELFSGHVLGNAYTQLYQDVLKNRI